MPKPVLAAVNGPAVGIGCSLALAADLIVARESAYFLLAFVNIGLVPDGGSSLLLPERVGLARATEMAMLGERIGARQALEWGLINRVAADDEFDGAVDELAATPGGRPDRRLRRCQAPAQRVAVRAHGRPARPGGVDPAAGRGVAATSRRASRRSSRSGPPRVRGAMTGRFPAPPVHILPTPWLTVPTKTRRRLRVLAAALPVAVLGALVLAPAASAGWFLPESDGSPNADGIRTLYILIALIGLVIFIGVEGLLVYSMIKFRARKGRVAAQIHGNTQLEIGWTVGAAAILIFLTVFTFVLLDDIKNPAASQIDAQGKPVAAANTLYASTDQPPPPGGDALNIRVDRPAVLVELQVPADNGEKRVYAYNDMYVPIGDDRHARHRVRRRRALVVDPAARRQDGRDPGLHEQELVPDPARRAPRGRGPSGLRGPVRRAVRPQPRRHARPRDRRCAYDEWKAWYDAQGGASSSRPRTTPRRSASGSNAEEGQLDGGLPRPAADHRPRGRTPPARLDARG